MKLLFDQNLSISLVRALADLFPNSAHVRDLGMHEADDITVWQFALKHGYAIITKDQDFNDRTALEELSPKIIWIRLGNCPTSQIEHLLRWRYQPIIDFGRQNVDSVLALP